MSWKERRIVTILTTIVLLLAAALLVVLGIRYRENRTEETQQLSTDSSSGSPADPREIYSYSALAYDNGSAHLSFTWDETASAWIWAGNSAFPLENTVISQILELVSNWAPLQTSTDVEILEKSGMDKPAGTLTATASDGTTTTLYFGKALEEGGRYVQRNTDTVTVYVIEDKLFQLMQIPIYDMCTLPKLPSIPESRIRSIVIRGAAPDEETPGVTTILSAQKADGEETSWRTSGGNVTDDPFVRGLMEDLAALGVEKCVSFNPSDEAAEICGFTAPPAELWVDYTTEGGADQSLRLTAGAISTDGAGRYVRLGEDSTIYLMRVDLLDPLMTLAAEGLG